MAGGKRLSPKPLKCAKLTPSSVGASAFFTRKRSLVQNQRRPPNRSPPPMQHVFVQRLGWCLLPKCVMASG